MDIYYIALACWFSSAFLVGLWSPIESLPQPSGFYVVGSQSYPLYQHNDSWRYRVPGGPWAHPSWTELIAHAETANGDPLIEE
jgi:hypothetical protein